ncbi:hypothetical protein [Lactiplantibacillus pentosus]|uniref:hypothetical protein n=1 Tax=Lactiplantibacillus pentosus TaxID=1589 RepID=UPI0021823FA2|nr:hypothetical protein [Lactiplantibacillus pentosus]MCT0160924.1 hypothetical protein [Lactiplantibacillus pentosus]
MTPAERQTAAEQAVAEKDWNQAANLWEQIYQDEQSAANNFQLVRALVADQQYVTARNYASEFEGQYLASDEAASVYLRALIANHEFISARIVIVARGKSDWTQAALTTLSAAENDAEAHLQSTLTTTMRHFYHLSDQPVQAQVADLQAARHLTMQRYLTAAKFLLVDPFLHPLTRSEVLYTLHELQVNTPVQMQWLLDDQQLTLCPAELTEVGADEISLATKQLLKIQLADQDVFLYENLRELLQLQLMYLYPRPELAITDPADWVAVLIAQQTGQETTNLSEEQEKMMKIQQKIQQFSLDLQQ